MTESLYKILNDRGQLTESDLAFCEPYFEPCSLPKNTIVEEENKVPRHLYFIQKGYMRLFYYDQDGDEVTTRIAAQNVFITSFLEFIQDKPSTLNLECVTDCEIDRIDRSRMAELIDRNERFKTFSVTIFEQAFVSASIRANDLATLTAEMRYKKLLDQEPEIIQNVPIQYIASYLGIKPQSLSRIRKQMIK